MLLIDHQNKRSITVSSPPLTLARGAEPQRLPPKADYH